MIKFEAKEFFEKGIYDSKEFDKFNITCERCNSNDVLILHEGAAYESYFNITLHCNNCKSEQKYGD